MTRPQSSVTRLLVEIGEGAPDAVRELVPAVYQELRRLAKRHLRDERRSHTLPATALVHEAYLRLIEQTSVRWEGGTHFFALASKAIRRILVDHARSRGAGKRGAGWYKLELEEVELASSERGEDLLELDEALSRLERFDARQARVVELRYFGGLTIEETARALAVSPATVKRDWELARAWLYRELGEL